MAITVYENSIVIGGTTISNTPVGISINKGFAAAVIRNEASGNMLGATYAYASGQWPGGSETSVNRFAFASQVTATEVGLLNPAITASAQACASSTTTGYMVGGGYQSKYAQKFPFATTGFTTVSWVALAPTQMLGAYLASGHQSSTSGYIGPRKNSGASPFTYVTTILKYPFATDNWTATQSGTGATPRGVANRGHSSTVSGYITGGVTGATAPEPFNTQIEKFWFASDSDAKGVGYLMAGGSRDACISSNLSGYIAHNTQSPQPAVSYIQKFPFAVDSNTADVGNLTDPREAAGGTGSRDGYGFVMGGIQTPYTGPFFRSSIERFAFANETTISTVGNLLTVKYGVNTHQI